MIKEVTTVCTITSDLNNWLSQISGSSIIKTINNILEPIKNWLETNSSNPVLWVTALIIGVIIFSLVFRSLNKDNRGE